MLARPNFTQDNQLDLVERKDNYGYETPLQTHEHSTSDAGA